jgi:uncharacterized membrane protein
MNFYLFLIMRITHIFGAVLWVGSAIFYFFLITPAVKSLGPSGGQFMQNLIGKQRLPIYMNLVSLVTILSGLYLYIYDSGGFRLGWIVSGPGTLLTIGSVVGIAVFFVGMLGIKPRGERIGALGMEIGKAGGPPSPAQLLEMEKLNREMHFFEKLDVAMLTIALLTMTAARFWVF